MKQCPKCHKTYVDETLNFCLDDGEWLVLGDEPATAILHDTDASGEAPTRAQIHMTDRTAVLPDSSKKTSHETRGINKMLVALAVALAVIGVARSGRGERGEEIVKRFEEIGKTEFVVPYRVAALHVALGNRDEAFAWLEKAYQAHDWHLHRLKVDPQFAPLRDDPRYNAMLKRLNLPE